MTTQSNQSCGTHDTTGSRKSWLLRNWKRIIKILSGHGVLVVLNWIINYPIYISIIAMFGMMWGLVIMTAFTFVLNAVILYVYERSGTDWVGFSLLADLEEKKEKRILERLLVWAHQRSQVLVFVLLSLYWDPFIAVAYVHRGDFDPSKRTKHMKLVFIATVIANLWWTIRQGIVLVGILWLWGQIKWW